MTTDTDRTCPHCHQSLLRRPDERAAKFAHRRFCDTTCWYHFKSGLTYGVPHHCGQCGMLLTKREGESPAHFEYRRFCDRACANRYKNALIRGKPNPNLQGPNNGMWGRTHTVEARERQRQGALAHPLTLEQQARRAAKAVGGKRSSKTRAKMAASRRLWWDNAPPEQRERHRQRIIERMPEMKSRFRRTSIERKMATELDRLDLRYQWNAPFLGRFCVDFLLLDYPVVIECDGDYWHSLPATQIRDAVKNAIVPEAGYTLLRFSEASINADLSACVDRIVDALRQIVPLPVSEGSVAPTFE